MCTVCGKQFHRSDYLKLHSFSHTDERPFSCHICGKGFKMKYNLKTHLKTHENSTTTVILNYDEISNHQEEKDNQSMIMNTNNDVVFSYSNNSSNSKINSKNNNNRNSQSINLNLNDPKLNSIVNTTTTNEIVSYYIQDVVDLDLRNSIQQIN
jgi:uncharacterized Zn-finger protein